MLKFFEKFIDSLYDDTCLICNKVSHKTVVCRACEESFNIRGPNQMRKNLQGITVYSWGIYEGSLRDGILKLKGGKRNLAEFFTKKLTAFWTKLPKEITSKDFTVIPVPSHKKRIKERGYCQTTLIADLLSKQIGYNFRNNIVIRTKETKYMNALNNINERIQNIQDAFKVTSDFSEENVKNILVIDDIVTSGSTMNELVKTIQKQNQGINLVGLTIASGDTYN